MIKELEIYINGDVIKYIADGFHVNVEYVRGKFVEKIIVQELNLQD